MFPLSPSLRPRRHADRGAAGRRPRLFAVLAGTALPDRAGRRRPGGRARAASSRIPTCAPTCASGSRRPLAALAGLGLRAARGRRARARPGRRRAGHGRAARGVRRAPRAARAGGRRLRRGHAGAARAGARRSTSPPTAAPAPTCAEWARGSSGRLRGCRRAGRPHRGLSGAGRGSAGSARPQGEVEARFTGPYNLAGLPAVSVPCGVVEGHLPVGLQLAAARDAEPLLLSVAAAYEERDRMRMHDVNWMQIERVPGAGRSDRPAAGLDRAARLPVAGHRRDPGRADRARGGGAAGRAGAAGDAVRADAVLRRLPGQPQPAHGHLPGGGAATCSTRCTARASGGSCWSTATAATPPAPALGAGVDGREPGRRRCSGTTGGAARAPGRWCSGSTPRAQPRQLDGEPALDAAGRRRAARAEAAGRRRSRLRDRRPRRRPRAARRRLLRRRATQRPDEEVLQMWRAGVEEVRELLETGWRR